MKTEHLIDGPIPTEFVQENEKYGVTANGELWKLGPYGYRAGYMMNPTDPGAFAVAIDNHEEEMRVMMAEARAEFGF